MRWRYCSRAARWTQPMAKPRRSRKRPGTGVKPAKKGVPVAAVGAPLEGSEAGDAGDVAHERMVRQVRHHRAAANRHFKTAQRLAGQASATAEQEARRAIAEAVNAFWWAEDSELEQAQHTLMHELGRWTRQRFGCTVHFDGERYSQRCPLDIAHKRFGFSIGYTAAPICSICGEDISECPHLPDKEYWERGGVGPSGYCPVCMRQGGCGHRSDRLYRVTPGRIITEAKLREVSIVARPAGVTTRLTELPIDTEKLVQRLGPGFEVGMPVSCDLCVAGCCWGFDELPRDAAERSKVMPDEQRTQDLAEGIHDEMT
jgi:hypothetical protein